MKKAIENGISIIRIPQNDIYRNINDWGKNLIQLLTYILTNKNLPIITYLTTSSIYENHMRDYENYDYIFDDICKTLQNMKI